MSEKICPKCGSKFADEHGDCSFDGTPLVERGKPEDPFLGLVIDNRLKVHRYLGAGGMGHVYVARQLDATQREVAVKFIRQELLKSEEDEKRFFREVRTLASGAHSNVVGVHFSGYAEVVAHRIPYFAMELIKGGPLSDSVGRGKKLAPLKACRITINICRGLQALHTAGLIHRDLKPANVLVPDGQDEDVKILDFGLAKGVQTSDETRITATNMVLGTPAYMSPEHMLGWELDPRSDLYSVGVILYELVTGERPVRESLGTVKRPDEVFPDLALPSTLSRLIVTLMEADREKRPGSAKEVRNVLQEIVEGLLTRPSVGNPALSIDPALTAATSAESLDVQMTAGSRTGKAGLNGATRDGAPFQSGNDGPLATADTIISRRFESGSRPPVDIQDPRRLPGHAGQVTAATEMAENLEQLQSSDGKGGGGGTAKLYVLAAVAVIAVAVAAFFAFQAMSNKDDPSKIAGKQDAEKRDATDEDAKDEDAEKRYAKDKADAKGEDAKDEDAKDEDAKDEDAEKRDAEKRDAEKRDAEKKDAEKKDAEKKDAEKKDAEKKAAARRAAEKKAAAEKAAAEKADAEKKDAEKAAAEKAAAEKAAAEKAAAEKAAAEKKAAEEKAAAEQKAKEDKESSILENN